MPFNLLKDPLIPVYSIELGKQEFSLPDLLAFYASGGEAQISGVRPHQEFLVYTAFVQLSVAALQAVGFDHIPEDSSDWLNALQEVAPLSAWDILQPDPTVAGFMQPPMSREAFEAVRLKKIIDDPLRMTSLVTSKDHVEKSQLYHSPTPWDWAVALISAQTSAGYGGVGNYGILRMNGGLGSRPFTALYSSLSHGVMWRRDVGWLLANFESITENYPIYSDEGIAALWTVPWDGTEQVAVNDLHPLFVDVARRYRIVDVNGRLQAVFANSSVPRIADPKDDNGLRGRTGDPWAPLGKGGAAVLTVQSSGWGHRLVADLLFGDGDTKRPPLLEDTKVGGDTCVAVLSVLVGGQGKTGGYHQREVVFPLPVLINLREAPEETRLTLADHSKGMIEEAAAISACMKTAAAAMWSGEFDFSKISRKDPAVIRAVDAAADLYDKRVDEVFFENLFDRYESGDVTQWNATLRGICESVLSDLHVRLTFPNGVRSRARAAGDNALGALWKGAVDRAKSNTKSKKKEAA